MNDFPFDPDDPRLTAYALGELSEGPDRTIVEQWLAESPEARSALEDVRLVTVLLASEYEDERVAVDRPNFAPAVGSRDKIIGFPAAASSSRWWSDPVLKIAAAVVFLMSLGVLVMPHILGDRRLEAMASYSPSGTQGDSAVQTPARAAALPATEIQAEDLSTVSPPAVFAVTDSLHPSAKSPASAPPPTPYVLALREPVPSGPLAASGSGGPAPTPDAAPTSLAEKPVVDAGTLAMNSPRQANHIRNFVAGWRSDDSLPRKSANAGEIREQLLTRRAAKDASEASLSRAESSDKRSSANETAAAPMPSVRALSKLEQADAPVGFSKQTESEEDFNTAAYDHVTENPFLAAKENPLSTFSIDVDTASYANVRRFIDSGSLPPAGAVRIEELLNYFPSSDAPPAEGNPYPFALHLEAAACPWNTDHRLVRIGIKGREMDRGKRPPSNLVFLLDVSGSMEPRDRLPLIKDSLRELVENLGEDDRVAIAVYAGSSGLALPSTRGNDKGKILASLDHLKAGGSTNGASGIRLAYQVARDNFIKGGVNRVILATDGDFNVGVTSQSDLVSLIETEAKSGVFLSALGVGNDNYKDSTMQKLADRGNGNYSYIDRLEEGRKVLVEQMTGTLVTIAKDVKIQVEFNPATVSSYRLIGYEKRMLRKEDFNDDKVDAGEIGAGHSVTALYEIVPAGRAETARPAGSDHLKYQPAPVATSSDAVGTGNGELLTLKMRYKMPEASASERAYEQALTDHPAPDDFASASTDFRFSAAVAGFGLVLKDSSYRGSATLSSVADIAHQSEGSDPAGYRAQFVELVRKARALSER